MQNQKPPAEVRCQRGQTGSGVIGAVWTVRDKGPDMGGGGGLGSEGEIYSSRERKVTV